ncbi:hypothetical protein RB595_008596 [Gaeumannomyces hyphopodioides]
MYPDWPRSDADLVPLPQCEGPKLKAFDFGGPQSIEFLELLGEGIHGVVFKVKMRGQLYALKLFRFCGDDTWPSPEADANIGDRVAMTALAQYAEPFNAECRAFGRLQEAGHEDLSVACFGYLLLDKTHEDLLLSLFPDIKLIGGGIYTFNFNNCPPYRNMRTRFLGRGGRAPPIRGIVKELVQKVPEDELTPALAAQILRDIGRFQQLGIFGLDIAIRQLMGNKTVVDFSTAYTIPHFIATPALNPHLTPRMLEVMRFETFQEAKYDYITLDCGLGEWNKQYGETKGAITLRAFPGGNGPPKLRSYELRNKAARERIFTHVNPTSYDWRRRFRAQKRPLRAKPPKWVYHFGNRPQMGDGLRDNTIGIQPEAFEYRDGYIWPMMD